MLNFYDKALVTSVLALAALAFPVSADTDDPVGKGGCDLSNGYGPGLVAFAREAGACLAAPTDAALETKADRVLALTDRAREKAGASPLVRRASLDDAARAHALDMAARTYGAHGDDTGRGHQDRVRILDRTGIFGAMGANVTVVDARLDAGQIYIALVSDPVNAANMGRPAFTHGGIGLAEAGGQVYLVQLFGQLDGELSEALPLGVPASAPIDVQFSDPGLSLVSWQLEDVNGQRIRRGTVNDLTRVGTETGDVSLLIEAEDHGTVYVLKGPAMTAETNGAAS